MPAKTSPGFEFYGGYQVYSDSGVDLTLLRENLKRSVEERIESNANAVKFVRELAGAGPAERNSWGKTGVFDAEGLLRQLVKHDVDFVVIGGLAMIAHGSAYVTRDLGICYSRAPKNMDAVVAALGPLHPYLRGAPPGLPFRFDSLTVSSGLNFTLTTDLGDIDLLGEVTGIGMFEQVSSQSADKEMFGLSVRILSLEGLISSKKAAGRLKDRTHLLELEELKKLRDANP